MNLLPKEFLLLIVTFAPLFSKPVWESALVLLVGRPRKVGKRLPTLKSLLDAPQTSWQTLTIDGWYGGRTCQLQVTSEAAVWYHTG